MRECTRLVGSEGVVVRRWGASWREECVKVVRVIVLGVVACSSSEECLEVENRLCKNDVLG